MNKFTKTALATTLLVSGFNTAIAEESEKTVDPSDLTAVNTTASFGMAGNGDATLSGSLGFALKNGQMAMTTLEGSLDKDGKYSDSRLQYFHVFNIGNAVVPKAGVSLDIIDNQAFTTAAVGAVAMFNPDVENLVFFGRAAVLGGGYSDFTADIMGESNTDIVGGMAAFYAVWKPGADGTYFWISPEFTYLDGDIETMVPKVTLTAGTPLSADAKHWGQIMLESSDTTMKDSRGNKNHDLSGTDTVITATYKVYF